MEVIRAFSGEGWLRIAGLAATTASYDIKIMRREATEPVGGMSATGFLATEMPSMMGAGLFAALVTLQDGSSHRGRITAVSARGVDVSFDAPLSLLHAA
ncbi:hypothetical protein [Ancylobacter oerskovii]|uniref:Uncharacterized protein n=1 Tax=Ancylobacter oerskovii TaxID=459519 RepID=A0ABW4YV42_9HYPH|nr:hypothetical protein [Ancylobacter oerskovii]MBS7543195.1 hypothetical protein [Ancylobacter oerskovii]